MKVSLIQRTQNAEKIVAIAGRTCTSDMDCKQMSKTYDDICACDAIIPKLHDGCLEHVTFTFHIEGVSRSLSHQLVRHRLASFDQQSQRYCKIDTDTDWYVVPPTIKNTDRNKYRAFMNKIADEYNSLIEKGIPGEDARFVLPNACKTNLVMTMNVRELHHFFALRCCNRAQWEIREMAEEMLGICKMETPLLFMNAGPGCVNGSGCKEPRPCGHPRLNEFCKMNEMRE